MSARSISALPQGPSPTIIFIDSLIDGMHPLGSSTFDDFAFLRRTATAVAEKIAPTG